MVVWSEMHGGAFAMGQNVHFVGLRRQPRKILLDRDAGDPPAICGGLDFQNLAAFLDDDSRAQLFLATISLVGSPRLWLRWASRAHQHFIWDSMAPEWMFYRFSCYFNEKQTN